MIALVDANNFYASCERLFRPDLRQQPIVVLSNNDGCVVARSIETKALGIGMAVPYYQIRHLCEAHHLQVFSSNYTLYGDLSNRVMTTLEQCCPEIEVYSIDEAFLDLRRYQRFSLERLCYRLHQKVLTEIDIPVSVGIAPTKTLAKLANHVAKRALHQPVFDMRAHSQQMRWLAHIDVEHVWGVGRKLTGKLKRQGIHSALDLRLANVATLRCQFGVTLEKVVRELNGIRWHNLETPEPKQNILSSKSFGRLQTDLNIIAEAMSHHCARAVQKLRVQDSVTGHVTVFLRTNPFRQELAQYSNSVSIPMVPPTDDLRTIIATAKKGLKALYRNHYQFHKCGVLLSALKPKGATQGDLFDAQPESYHHQSNTMMSVMDAVNSKFGRGAIQLAAQGFEKQWRMQSNNKSPSYTTQWDHLVFVKAS